MKRRPALNRIRGDQLQNGRLKNNCLILIVLITTLVSLACGIMTLSTPTSQPTVESPLKQELIGRWRINHGRFGNAVLEFSEAGALIVTNMDSGEVKELEYSFVATDTLLLTGDNDLAGTAKIAISGNKLELVITFSDQVFGEIYPPLYRVK